MAPSQDDANLWQTVHEVVGRYVHVRGVRTYYETMGDKGPITFLGVHSAGRECRQWQQMGDLLGEVGQFVSLDFPGHGKSWPLPGNHCLATTDEIASFIWEFRNAAGITGPTVVLGCSIGGNLVFQLAAENPDEVAALISFQGVDLTLGPTASALLFMDHPRVNPAYSHAEQTIALTGKRTPAKRQEYLSWDVCCLNSATLKADLTAYSNFDFRKRMGEIRCPALLVRGQDDFAVGAEMVRQTAERLINAKVVEVVMPEGVGHYAHVEQPVELGRLALDFLRRQGIIT
jgi:pimeloyl-ACP methyl ester carboxylesterase